MVAAIKELYWGIQPLKYKPDKLNTNNRGNGFNISISAVMFSHRIEELIKNE